MYTIYTYVFIYRGMCTYVLIYICSCLPLPRVGRLPHLLNLRDVRMHR